MRSGVPAPWVLGELGELGNRPRGRRTPFLNSRFPTDASHARGTWKTRGRRAAGACPGFPTGATPGLDYFPGTDPRYFDCKRGFPRLLGWFPTVATSTLPRRLTSTLPRLPSFPRSPSLPRLTSVWQSQSRLVPFALHSRRIIIVCMHAARQDPGYVLIGGRSRQNSRKTSKTRKEEKGERAFYAVARVPTAGGRPPRLERSARGPLFDSFDR